MKTYKIYQRDVTLQSGEVKTKIFIQYFSDEILEREEFYGLHINEPQLEIRVGYTKHPESL